jgi:CRP-like cAMP-binding protein
MKIYLFEKEEFTEHYPVGRVVFRAGERGDLMFAVIEGAVDIIIRGKVVETVEKGGVFGEMALVEDRPRVATAIVTSDAKLARINRSRFVYLVQQNPYFALQLMTVMSARLRRMDEEFLIEPQARTRAKQPAGAPRKAKPRPRKTKRG